tara:strand:+ start:1474 stop:2112 length:639 start_codon:yes stop_codon:yes gene_type:complete
MLLMGNSQSEHIDFEKETNSMTKKFWNEDKYLYNHVNKQYENRGTVNLDTVIPILGNIFNNFNKKINILEVGSGNGFNTKLIYNNLSKYIDELKATDIQIHSPSYFKIEKLKSHDAVYKYGKDIDILMLISPPCIGFMDYYAIKTYELLNSDKDKYVIYIGELGASDGATGMYKYMMEESEWNLIKSVEFSETMLMYGEYCVKEVFLFKWKK